MSCWWHQLFHDAQPHFNPNFNPNFNPYTNPYPAGPAGQNGTQQFAKLQDSQLFEVAKTQAARGFWKQYYNKENIKESTRRLITNLPAIVKEAVGILLNIQKQYGYNPEETVGAIKRHLWKNQMVSKNPAMRMFIAAFGIASILIEVNAGASQNPSTDTKTPQTPKTPQGSQRASRRTVVLHGHAATKMLKAPSLLLHGNPMYPLHSLHGLFHMQPQLPRLHKRPRQRRRDQMS